MLPEHTEAAGAVLPLLVAVGLGAAYAAAAYRDRRGWPARRTVLWLAGLVGIAAALTGPLARAADVDFRAHAVAHLLLGMAGPLLLVAAAPVTLLLRVLPVTAARRVTGFLGLRPVRWLTEPVVAAVLNVATMWLLYFTPAYALTHLYGGLHLLVHAHLLISGYLLTVALVSRDPLPHRRGFGHRAVVLVLVLAAHNVLAKSLYAAPPPGVPAAQAETGAMIMYYGGDAVALVLVIWLCALWYRARRRAGPHSSDRSAAQRATAS